MADYTVPATKAVAVVLDAVLVECRALYVGVGGNISINLKDVGTAVIFTGVPSGTILPVMATKVNTTSTTATNMVALS